MSLETLTETAEIAGYGTYAVADTLTENYTTTASISDGTGTKSLAVKYRWPDVDDPETPRPLVVLCGTTAGWATSSATVFDAGSDAANILSCGVNVAVVATRVTGDSPLSTGDDATHTTLRRAIRASVFDMDAAIKYTLKNHLENDDWTIEPNMIFLGGMSAGGITCLLYPLFFPSRPIVGLFPMSAAYGLDGVGTTPNTATEIIRKQLRYTERNHTAIGMPFLGGADTTVGTTYIESYRTKQGTIGDSTVQYDTDGTHTTYATFDTSALTGATTVYGAIANFIKDRRNRSMSTSALRQRGLLFSRSWVKLQSRYW